MLVVCPIEHRRLPECAPRRSSMNAGARDIIESVRVQAAKTNRPLVQAADSCRPLPTVRRGELASVMGLQRFAGNRAVSELFAEWTVQRQPRPDASAQAQATAQQPVLGGPASTGEYNVVTFEGVDVPAPADLHYPEVPAPDRDHRYQNWHRVRFATIWVLRRIGDWTRVPGDTNWRRELEWGRLRMAATETWLIRRGWFWSTNVRTVRGTVSLATSPFQSEVHHQRIGPPPAAEGSDWQPDSGALLTGDQAPAATPTALVEKLTARTLTSHLFSVNAVRAATGGEPVTAQSGNALGGQFVLTQIIRSLVSQNDVVSSVFDLDALWVRSVEAPRST